MIHSRLTKSAKLGIALQLTEVTEPGAESRLWEVHDVERNRGFRVTLAKRTLTEAPPGEKPAPRAWTEAEIEAAVGLAVERALLTPGEKLAGPLYEVEVISQDLFDQARLG
jgi:hypothetical protein